MSTDGSQTDRQTYGQTDRQTYGQTDRQTDELGLMADDMLKEEK